jgi:hypothetical protein
MLRRLVCALALLFVSVGASAQNSDFDLVNRTGYPIRELYVSPAKSKSWGADILGKHVIQNGELWHITAPRSGQVCRYDIQIVFDDDGSEVAWEGFNLCEISKITLSYNRKSGETTATYE